MKPCKPNNLFRFCAVLFGLLLLTACGNSDEPGSATIEKPEKVVPVSTEIVKPLDLTEYFTLPAGLEAREDLVLSAEIAGPIRKINYAEGQTVKAGAVLLEIDPEMLESNLARDKENFAVSTRKLKRYRQLSTEGLVSKQELDEQENIVIAAGMLLTSTRLQLEKCYPKAPISGVVDLHYIDRGEYIEPGKALMRLVQIDKLEAIADVPEKDISFLHVGQLVEIIPAIINAQNESTLSGEIEHIAFAAEETTRTYRTKIVLDNSSELLRPGMIVRARFVRQQLQQVLSAPLYAVLDRDGEKLVYVEEAGLAKEIKVETGSSIDQRIVITSGLEVGQKLIVKGQQLLIDGVKITPQEN